LTEDREIHGINYSKNVTTRFIMCCQNNQMNSKIQKKSCIEQKDQSVIISWLQIIIQFTNTHRQSTCSLEHKTIWNWRYVTAFINCMTTQDYHKQMKF